jgi:hypothetical protein
MNKQSNDNDVEDFDFASITTTDQHTTDPDGGRDRTAAAAVRDRAEPKTELPPLKKLGRKFERRGKAYNTTLRQVLVRCFHDYLVADREGTVRKSKGEMRKRLGGKRVNYEYGSWFALALRCDGGFRDAPFASAMAQVLRADLHIGFTVEELEKEIFSADWDPRRAIEEARDFLFKEGLAANKRRQNRKQLVDDALDGEDAEESSVGKSGISDDASHLPSSQNDSERQTKDGRQEMVRVSASRDPSPGHAGDRKSSQSVLAIAFKWLQLLQAGNYDLVLRCRVTGREYGALSPERALNVFRAVRAMAHGWAHIGRLASTVKPRR